MKLISLCRVQLMKIRNVKFENTIITGPTTAREACRTFLLDEYQGCFPDREIFGVLWLDTKNKLAGLEIISVGSLNASIVHPREVFKSGILHNAASFLCFHNHPSGFAHPSSEDQSITERLMACGDLLGIELLDHLILTEDFTYSFKEEGLI